MKTQTRPDPLLETESEPALILRPAAIYLGLSRPKTDKYLPFASDALYNFPILNASAETMQRTGRDSKATLRSNLFTPVEQVSTVETLAELHEASPFRRGVAPEIAPVSGSFSFAQEGREPPTNTINTDSSHASREPDHKHNSTEELLKRTKELESSDEEPGESSFEASPIRTPPLRTMESGESIMRSDSLQDDFGVKRRTRRSMKTAIRDYSEEIPSDEEAEASISSNDGLSDRLMRLSTNKDFKRIVELIPEEYEDDSALMFKSIDALKRAGVIHEDQDEDESEADVNISAEQIHLVPREINVKANKPTCQMQQVQPKVLLGNSMMQMSTFNESMQTFQQLPLAIDVPDVNSPICRKLVVCEEHKRGLVVESREAVGSKMMDIASAIPCAGYKTTIGLEFSNVEGKSKAVVNYSREGEKLPVKLLTPSIVRFFLSTPVMWLSCGFEHCALVTLEGEVFTWGYGGSGALGHGNTMSYPTPTRVQNLAGQGIVYLECGGYHNAAINESGRLWMWGRGDVNQLGVSFKKLLYDELGYLALAPLEVEEFGKWRRAVKGVACGEAHTLVLDSMGSVYSFGWAEDGQLGLPNSAISEGMMTTKIERIEDLNSEKIIKISAGSLFSTALTESGSVYTWGSGEQGQLGLGSKALHRDKPTLMSALSAETIIDIVCGENYVIAMSQEGKMFGWGQGVAGDFEGGQFVQGSELVCYVPRNLAEVDIVHHIAIYRLKKKTTAERPSFLWALEEELRRLELED